MNKDEVLKKLKDGECVYSNNTWWLRMKEDGSIIGGCYEPDCCHIEYENFDEMWRHGYDADGWTCD